MEESRFCIFLIVGMLIAAVLLYTDYTLLPKDKKVPIYEALVIFAIGIMGSWFTVALYCIKYSLDK